MKRLLLLLFATLGFVSSANTVTYDYSYSGDSLNGSDGSSCYVNKYGYGDSIICDNGAGAEGVLGYTSAPMDLGYQSGEAAGNILNAIADAFIQGMKNEQASKENRYVLPAINNSLRNTPFYNFGTTYKSDGGTFSGSDGIRCSFFSENELNCNNAVNYYLSSPTKMRGSDGTTYVSNWKNDSDNSYYCVTSSFGSKCCGNRTSKTCSSK